MKATIVLDDELLAKALALAHLQKKCSSINVFGHLCLSASLHNTITIKTFNTLKETA